MQGKPFIVQIYKKNKNTFVLQEEHELSSKIAGINQFNAYINECGLNEKDIEKVDEKDSFIWRLKTDMYLLILRKDFSPKHF